MILWNSILILVLAAWSVNGECQCGIFLTNSEDTSLEEVYLGSIYPQACDKPEVKQNCKEFCYQTFSNLTADGHLEAVSPVFNVSSAEVFCKNLNKGVTNREVTGYYRWCQTSWKFVGIRAVDKLCCRNGNSVKCQEPEATSSGHPIVADEVVTEGPTRYENSSQEESGNASFADPALDLNDTRIDTRLKRSVDEDTNGTAEEDLSITEQTPRSATQGVTPDEVDSVYLVSTTVSPETEVAKGHPKQIVRRSPPVTVEGVVASTPDTTGPTEEYDGRSDVNSTIEVLSERADSINETDDQVSPRNLPVAEVLQVSLQNATEDISENVTFNSSRHQQDDDHYHVTNDTVQTESADLYTQTVETLAARSLNNTDDDQEARFVDVTTLTDTVDVSARNAVTEEGSTSGLDIQYRNASYSQQEGPEEN